MNPLRLFFFSLAVAKRMGQASCRCKVIIWIVLLRLSWIAHAVLAGHLQINDKPLVQNLCGAHSFVLSDCTKWCSSQLPDSTMPTSISYKERLHWLPSWTPSSHPGLTFLVCAPSTSAPLRRGYCCGVTSSLSTSLPVSLCLCLICRQLFPVFPHYSSNCCPAL